MSILQSEISSLIKTKRVLDTDIQRKGSNINNMKNKLAKLESLVNLKLTKKEYINIEKLLNRLSGQHYMRKKNYL